jgi:TetR/AcrR family transcriptional regulator, cholesterol catabolism regulator
VANNETVTAQSEIPQLGSRHGRAGAPRGGTTRAQAREESIYRAAARIFQRKGYAATSLQDIADEVGLLKGSLYYYIESKEDLLYGITRYIHAVAREVVEETRAMDGLASDRLAHLIERHIVTMIHNLDMTRAFYTDYNALSSERRASVMHERTEYERFTQELIEEGQAAGEFCTELDAHLMTSAILTMLNSVYMWFHEREGVKAEAIAQGYQKFVLNGLRCPPDHVHEAQPAAKSGRARSSAKRPPAKATARKQGQRPAPS